MGHTSDFDAFSRLFLHLNMPTLLPVASLLLAALLLALWTKRDVVKRPPGPAGEPLLGNAREIPADYSWLRYTQLAKQFGRFLACGLDNLMITDNVGVMYR